MDIDIFKDIAARCGGEINVAVAGAVRSGKSTLVKKFMTELVIPNMQEGTFTEELPQTGGGADVVTLSPRFVPKQAARVKIGDMSANARFCDCAGIGQDGAADSTGRALSLSDMGICVTCDGSIPDIPREGYAAAEEQAVREFKAAGKPFIVLLNCAEPLSDGARLLKERLAGKYGCPVLAENCENIGADGLLNLFKALLFEFPVSSFDIKIPEWLQVMPKESSAIDELLSRVRTAADKICKMSDCAAFDDMLEGCKYWDGTVQLDINLASGRAEVTAAAKEGIFFEMLSELAGDGIDGESALMRYISGAAEAKKSYDKIKDALECAKATGYGIVQPDDADLSLDAPQLVRKGASVGIKLKATAPSYHIVKVDISSEVSPIMGSAAQSESIVQGMMNGFESNPESMWDTDVFGKSLRGMVKDGLNGKACGMQEDTKSKMRRAITRIVNEGKGGVICILL